MHLVVVVVIILLLLIASTLLQSYKNPLAFIISSYLPPAAATSDLPT
jgi:hypothetical protein